MGMQFTRLSMKRMVTVHNIVQDDLRTMIKMIKGELEVLNDDARCKTNNVPTGTRATALGGHSRDLSHIPEDAIKRMSRKFFSTKKDVWAMGNEKILFSIDLMQSWVPFGTVKVVSITSEAGAMLVCFYVGLYCLTYKDIISEGALYHVVIFVPIVLMMFLLVPSLLVQRTMCECITHPDSELIGEVQEFMADNLEQRKMLVSTLFPDFDLHLMEPVDWSAILEVFDRFDDDRSFTITPLEFLHGTQLLRLHLSSYKANRLVRLIDSDRSGEIEPDEIFELVYEEKMDRVVQKVQGVFERLGEPVESMGALQEMKMEHMERMLTMLYNEGTDRSGLPDGLVQRAIAHVKESDDDTLFNIKDFTKWAKDEIASGRGEAFAQMTLVKKELMESTGAQTKTFFRDVIERARLSGDRELAEFPVPRPPPASKPVAETVPAPQSDAFMGSSSSSETEVPKAWERMYPAPQPS